MAWILLISIVSTVYSADIQLVPAVFTPYDSNGFVNLKAIQGYVEFLLKQNISESFVCGTNGESLSLTIAERKQIANEWVF